MIDKKKKEKGEKALADLILKLNNPQPKQRKRVGQMIVDRWFSNAPHPLVDFIQTRQEVIEEQRKTKLETEPKKTKRLKVGDETPSYIS